MQAEHRLYKRRLKIAEAHQDEIRSGCLREPF